jgi:hypothetical protein
MKRHIVVTLIPLLLLGCEIPKPKINAGIEIRAADVLVTNKDSFSYNNCTLETGAYKTKVGTISASTFVAVPWSRFRIVSGAPPPTNASVGWFNPLILDCTEGRWRGAIE